MGRWEPDARGRLLHAALELFADQGYEATTAAQIAERAGLTKATLFRQFADKREILFQGQPALVSIAKAGVDSAPDDASAVEMVEAGLRALADEHVPEQQEIGRRIEVIVASSPELQERAAYKRSTIAAALETALAGRLEDQRLAGALADLGVRAYYAGFSSWIDLRRDEQLSTLVLDELAALRAVLLRSMGATRRIDEHPAIVLDTARPDGSRSGSAASQRTPSRLQASRDRSPRDQPPMP